METKKTSSEYLKKVDYKEEVLAQEEKIAEIIWKINSKFLVKNYEHSNLAEWLSINYWNNKPFNFFKEYLRILSFNWLSLDKFFDLEIEKNDLTDLDEKGITILKSKTEQTKLNFEIELEFLAKILEKSLFQIFKENKINFSEDDIEKLEVNNSKIFLKLNDESSLELILSKNSLKRLEISQVKEINTEKLSSEIDSTNRNNELFTTRDWIVSIELLKATKNDYFSAKTFSYITQDWKKHNVILKDLIVWEKSEILSEVLNIIEKTSEYKVKIEWWKMILTLREDLISVEYLRQELNNISIEELKEGIKDSGMSESELNIFLNSELLNANKYLDNLSSLHWDKIPISVALFSFNELAINSLKKTSVPFGAWVYVLLFPLFLKEIHKKPWNLDSYFKSFAEMWLFLSWAQLSTFLMSLIIKSPGIRSKIFIWATSVLAWMLTLVLWEEFAKKINLQKGFDSIFPESEDWWYKKLWMKNDNILWYLSTWWWIYELVDFFWTDIKIPYTPIKFWETKVDVDTNIKDFLSVWIFRNKDFYNQRLKLFFKESGEEVIKKINYYKENWNTKDNKDINDLKLDIMEIFWNMEFLYIDIVDNIEYFISSDYSETELMWIIMKKVTFFELNEESLDSHGKINQYSMDKLKITLRLENPEWLIFEEEEPFLNDLIIYISSLDSEEKKYLIDYCDRIINREEVIKDSDKKYPYMYFPVGAKSPIFWEKSIYKHMIEDEAIIDLWNWEKITKWDFFHRYTMYVKDLKENKFFVENMKRYDENISYKDISEWEKLIWSWTSVNKIKWWLEIEYLWEKFTILLDDYWKINKVQFWDKSYIAQTWFKKYKESKHWDSMVWYWDFVYDEPEKILAPFPYVFIDTSFQNIVFRNWGNNINNAFVRDDVWSIKEFLEKLKSWKKFMVAEDFDFYFDFNLIPE